MDERPRIIVVDDEAGVRDTVAEYLSKHGFLVRTAVDGRALDACLAAAPADLVLLDVNMPGEDGFSVARRLRAAGDTPIMMVTAADEVIDRVLGLELGADDYVVKPFDLRELRARIRSVLRRQRQPPQPPGAPVDRAELVSFGRFALDLTGRRLIDADGNEVRLTAMEFDLLAAFARSPNRVLSRDRLLELAHNRDWEPFDRSIDIRIARIRRKIETEPAKPAILRTIRGAGYMFVPPKRS